MPELPTTTMLLPPDTDTNTASLETWREAHALLLRACKVAQDAVAVKRARRRYLLDQQIRTNLNDTGNLETATSVWKRPVPIKKSEIRRANKAILKKYNPYLTEGGSVSKKGTNKTGNSTTRKKKSTDKQPASKVVATAMAEQESDNESNASNEDDEDDDEEVEYQQENVSSYQNTTRENESDNDDDNNEDDDDEDLQEDDDNRYSGNEAYAGYERPPGDYHQASHPHYPHPQHSYPHYDYPPPPPSHQWSTAQMNEYPPGDYPPPDYGGYHHPQAAYSSMYGYPPADYPREHHHHHHPHHPHHRSYPPAANVRTYSSIQDAVASDESEEDPF